MGKFMDMILDFFLRYKVVGMYYAGKFVSVTSRDQDGTVRGHEEQYGNRIYWIERFFTKNKAMKFINGGRSRDCGLSGGNYFTLLRTENEGKTFIIWDNSID